MFTNKTGDAGTVTIEIAEFLLIAYCLLLT